MDEQWSRGEHLLFWVHTGRASVELASGDVHALSAGEGLWVPAGIDRSLHTEAESVAIPTLIQPGSLPSPPEEVLRFEAHEGWHDWLIQHYVHWFTPVTRPGYTPAEILEVVTTRGAKRHQAPRADAHTARQDSPTRLRLPGSASARLVARELMRNPALDHTVEQWAVLVSTSPSTLRRDFVNDTGLTFARWRARCRLSTAEDLLAAGHDIGWVAHHVGYSSRNGFTRAFRTEHKRPPSEFAKSAIDSPPPHLPRLSATTHGPTLRELFTDQLDSPPEKHTVPATYSPPLTYEDENVLLWTYRGASWARVGDQEFNRAQGDALWLVAGRPHETRSPEDCIDVPIGSIYGPDMPTSEPLRTSFPPSWDTYLLHCSVTNYTMLRPDSYDPRHILALFDEQLASHRAMAVPMPADPVARTAATEFLRHISKPIDPMAFLPRDLKLDTVFKRETGMTVSAWRRTARMNIARDLLTSGTKPSSVANRVGYPSLSAFSHAFTRFHGFSPRGVTGGEKP